MEELTSTPNSTETTPRKLWVRALLMLLMCAAFQLAASVLLFVALLQLIFSAVTDTPNARLTVFGHKVGRYLAQIADFASFRTDDAPFPFSDWPADEGKAQNPPGA
jgi:Domain of unknown function (DUF4389)